MIAVKVIGAATVTAKFKAFPANAREALAKSTMRLAIEAQRRVMETKLTGQVLHVRTGRLRRSINVRAIAETTAVGASTGTNVWYGRMWELSGFRAHDVVPTTKKALFWPGGRHPVRRVSIPAQAARPFLLPVLSEMREQAKAEMTAAAREAF